MMSLVPELVKALYERQGLGFGISYYIRVNHPGLEYTHSDMVQLAYALAEQHPGAYIVDGLVMTFAKCSETSVKHLTEEEGKAEREAKRVAKWGVQTTNERVPTPHFSEDADPEDADPEDADPEDADPEDADPEDADPEDADPEDADPEDADPEEPTHFSDVVDGREDA